MRSFFSALLFTAVFFQLCAHAADDMGTRFSEILSQLDGAHGRIEGAHPSRTSATALLSPEERADLYREGVEILAKLPKPPYSKSLLGKFIAMLPLNAIILGSISYNLATTEFYIPGNTAYNIGKAAQIVGGFTMTLFSAISTRSIYKSLRKTYEIDFGTLNEPFLSQLGAKNTKELLAQLVAAYESMPRTRVEEILTRVEAAAECESYVTDEETPPQQKRMR